MESIKMSDIYEETIYTFDCPYCTEINETSDLTDWENKETTFCQHCDEEIEILT
jgi:predicted Zn-dependent protease